MDTLQYFGPCVLLCAGGLTVLMLEAFRKDGDQATSGYIAAAVQCGALVLVWLQVFIFKTQKAQSMFEGAIQIDSFSLFLTVILLLSGIFSSIAAVDYLRRQDIRHGEYHCFQLFAVLGMIIMVMSRDLITMFVALEMMSICLYLMCGYRRNDPRGIESALKYFLLGGFGAAILLFGIAHIYGQLGVTTLPEIAEALRAGSAVNNPGYLKLGVGLFCAGFLFKIAAVPLHYWLPDVYEGAPAPVTGFMAAAVKAAAFGVFIRFLYLAYAADTGRGGLDAPIGQTIALFACLTMIIPNLIALCQISPKRILAFSSIAHAGYMLVGVRAMSMNFTGTGDPALAAILFYLAAYGLMTAGAFFVIGLLSGVGEERDCLDDFDGLGYRNPFLSAVLVICLLSLAGVPPLAGFWGKYLVFKAAVDGGYIGLALFGVLSSVIAVFYYLRIIVHLYMHAGPEVDPSSTVTEAQSISLSVLIKKNLIYPAALFLIAFSQFWLGAGPKDILKVIPASETFWKWSLHAAGSLVS